RRWLAMHKFIAIVIAVLMTGCAAKTSRAPVVRPLAGHPGNIFLQSEDVTVSLPSGTEEQWEARDYDGKTIAHGLSIDGKASLGELAVGYYEVKRKGGDGRLTVGVIAPLLAPTPDDTPVASDVAMSWF